MALHAFAARGDAMNRLIAPSVLAFLLALAPAPASADGCSESGSAVAPDGTGVALRASQRHCETAYEGGEGEWWYDAFVQSDTTEVALETSQGSESVFVRKWNESIAYGDASGSGKQHGDFVEAGHASSLGGGWRYQTVRTGTDGWAWNGTSTWTESDAVGVEAQAYDSEIAYWYTTWLKLQHIDADYGEGASHGCYLFVGSTAIPPELYEVLAPVLKGLADPPHEACILL